MSHGLPRGGELGQITCHPQHVESAQIVNVQSDVVEYLALTHVFQGQTHQVQVIQLHLPMLGKVADHGVSSDPARKAFCDLLVPPGIEVCVQMPGPLLDLVVEGLVGWLLFLGLLGGHALLGAGLALLLPHWWGLPIVIGLYISLLVGAKDMANTREGVLDWRVAQTLIPVGGHLAIT